MSEIKLKQEVIDSIQERIDKKCYFVGEDWVISSDETLEIVADVLQKTMERILTRLEELNLDGFEMIEDGKYKLIRKKEAIAVVKEVGGIE